MLSPLRKEVIVLSASTTLFIFRKNHRCHPGIMDPQSLLDDHPEIGAPDRWHAAKLLPHPGILLSVMIGAAAIAGASQATGSDRQAVPNHPFGSCSPSSGACAT